MPQPSANRKPAFNSSTLLEKSLPNRNRLPNPKPLSNPTRRFKNPNRHVTGKGKTQDELNRESWAPAPGTVVTSQPSLPDDYDWNEVSPAFADPFAYENEQILLQHEQETKEYEENRERQAAVRIADEARIRAEDPPISEDLDPERRKLRQRARDDLVIEKSKNWMIVDTPEQVTEMGESLVDLPSYPPSLYADSEGRSLSRWGTITILTIFVRPKDKVFIIDLNTLKHAAFDTPFRNGQTLRTILENQDIPICFWDVRKDSDAIYKHFQVHLRGVVDVQLMELRARWFNTKDSRINGYGPSVETLLKENEASKDETDMFKEIKEFGKKMFEQENWDLLDQRPMTENVKLYCALDVHYGAHLFDDYRAKLGQGQYLYILEKSKWRANQCLWSDEEAQWFHNFGEPTASPWNVNEVEIYKQVAADITRNKERAHLQKEKSELLTKLHVTEEKLRKLDLQEAEVKMDRDKQAGNESISLPIPPHEPRRLNFYGARERKAEQFGFSMIPRPVWKATCEVDT